MQSRKSQEELLRLQEESVAKQEQMRKGAHHMQYWLLSGRDILYLMLIR